jgi:hypothetical protein
MILYHQTHDTSRNESNKWKANGPKVYGKYPTGNNLFKVKEFENGTPQVSYETFKKMAESVFSHCHYEFYWDSERYGSWQAAAQNGGMNCSDSSDFLIALAHACGLSASQRFMVIGISLVISGLMLLVIRWIRLVGCCIVLGRLVRVMLDLLHV